MRFYGFNDSLYRNGNKICSGAAFYHRFIDRLIPFVIGDAAIVDVDTDSFYGNFRSAACLSDA